MAGEIHERAEHCSIQRIEPEQPQLRVDDAFASQHLRNLLQVVQLLQPCIQRESIRLGDYAAIDVPFINQRASDGHARGLQRFVRLHNAVGNQLRQRVDINLVGRCPVPLSRDERRAVIVTRTNQHRVTGDVRLLRHERDDLIHQIASNLHEIHADDGEPSITTLHDHRIRPQRIVRARAQRPGWPSNDGSRRRCDVHLAESNM